MLANTRRISSYTVYLILSFGYGLGFTTMTTYNGLYQFDIAHLNALQLVLVGTVLETVCFICQVPTGVLADLYTRKRILVAGLTVQQNCPHTFFQHRIGHGNAEQDGLAN